ncbi:hypothetical protein ABZ639_06640 [Saccharomonospora sp. NPDC006951]
MGALPVTTKDCFDDSHVPAATAIVPAVAVTEPLSVRLARRDCG